MSSPFTSKRARKPSLKTPKVCRHYEKKTFVFTNFCFVCFRFDWTRTRKTAHGILLLLLLFVVVVEISSFRQEVFANKYGLGHPVAIAYFLVREKENLFFSCSFSERNYVQAEYDSYVPILYQKLGE